MNSERKRRAGQSQWDFRLSREAARLQTCILHPPSITKLNKTLSNLFSPSHLGSDWIEEEGGWNRIIMRSPFQPEKSCNPMILWNKISEVNQRPRDVTSEDMRPKCHFCQRWMLLWMVGSYLLYCYHSMAYMSVFPIIVLPWGKNLLPSPFSLPSLLQ